MGLFADTFAALVELEQTVSADLRVYPWQPRRRPNEDCIWNWIVPDEGEAGWPDPSKHRDVLVMRATIAVKESADSMGQVDRLAAYTDAFVNVVDPALHAADSRPWLLFSNGACGVYAERQGMNTALYPYSPQEPPLLAMDFPIRIQLDRNTFA